MPSGSFLFDLLLESPKVMPYDVAYPMPIIWVTELTKGTFELDSTNAIKIKLDISIPI